MAKKAGLTIAINAVTGPFQRGLREVKRSLRAFAKSFAGQMLGLFAVSRVTAFFKSMIDGFGKIEEASQRLGVGIERIQQLEYAAKQTGFGIDTMRSSLQKLQKTTGEAINGGKEQASVFAQLGLELDELKDLSPDRLLDKVAVALREIDNPLERAALQTKLFGKSGLELNEFLKNYIRLGNDAKAQGLIIDEETVKQASYFGDAITAISKATTAWVASIPKVREILHLLGGINEIVTAKGKAVTSGTMTREEAYAAAAKAIVDRAPDGYNWAAVQRAANALGSGGETSTSAENDRAVADLNAELDRMGYGVFKAEQKKAAWYNHGDHYYGLANPAVESATKRLTPEEQKAEAERLKAAKDAAEAEKKKRAQQREAAKAAADQAEADKKAKERQKLIDKVVGGSEASALQMRLKAQSPALAEYMAAISQITAAGQTLTAAEDERLRRSIAERMAMENPDKEAKEAATPRFIEAVTRGSIEDYKIRTAAGGDIPTKQLKVAEGQAKDVKTIAAEIKKMADGQRNTIGVGAL